MELFSPSTSLTKLYSSPTATTETTAMSSKERNDCQLSSLASSYVIRINEEKDGDEVWSLVPLKQSTGKGGEGAIAVKALQAYNEDEHLNGKTSTKLRCTTITDVSSSSASVSITVQNDKYKEEDADLISVLSRLMVQRGIDKLARKDQGVDTVHIILSEQMIKENDEKVNYTIKTTEMNKMEQAAILFASFLPASSSSIEWVEMVDASGSNMLGILPRILVHKLNLLHRGIGVVVLSDHDHQQHQTENVYVHRRTDTKRIFPSLYDMFVGGVSSAFEDSKLTAAREVAEEIGLSKGLQQQLEGGNDDAIDEKTQILSNELFKCVICTSYNRCVVTVFTYDCMENEKDSIKWQEEEVAWGGFVPYDVVEKSARLSIDRLKEGGKWPGTGMDEEEESEEVGDHNKLVEGSEEVWKKWDYVPDGLLVWEAWLRWKKSV